MRNRKVSRMLSIVFSQNMAKMLLANNVAGACKHLDSTAVQTPLDKEMVDIVIHSFIVLHAKRQNPFVQPLWLLARHPSSMQVSTTGCF